MVFLKNIITNSLPTVRFWNYVTSPHQNTEKQDIISAPHVIYSANITKNGNPVKTKIE